MSRALLPQWLARLLGLAALGSVGALEWQRLLGGMSSARALLWMVTGVAAAAGVLAAGRLRPGWGRAGALVLVTVAAVFVVYALSGAPLSALRPHSLDDLASGLGGGAQALGTVRLPYSSADPWPRIVLEGFGGLLLVVAGLLTFWPRAAAVAAEDRGPLEGPDRGFPFGALAVLIVLVASPVISLGGKESLFLGLVLAALTVAFLWLERLPLRPGLGLAGLLALALVGALPIAAAADRGEAWFDYRSFAEGLGPDDPVRFSWAQDYGPITWPRDGNEVLRVASSVPLYWKARNLDAFNGRAWTATTEADPAATGGDAWRADLAPQWRDHPNWVESLSVSVRRMRTQDVVGAGTVLSIDDPSRSVQPGISPGTWDAPDPLRRGDSYDLKVFSPHPASALLETATSGARLRRPQELTVTVPFKPGAPTPGSIFRAARARDTADVEFKGWNAGGVESHATFPRAGRSEFDVDAVMERSLYARTWEVAKRLKRGAETPYEYVQRVAAFLADSSFIYTERPPATPAGVAPLDAFINDTHAGYCQHYAGAMALLLRMGGVPARVATGFSPGGYSARKKAWIVRDTDAHAWVEAWFDRYGWITMDPTPDATPARSQIASVVPSSSAATLAPDRATPGADTSADAADGSIRPNLLLDTNGSGAGSTGDGGGISPWLVALGLAALVGAAGAVVLVVRRPRGATPMDRAIAELEEALRRVGRPVAIGTTLSQLERRLGSHSPEVAAYLRALAAGRYAAAPPAPPRTGRRALRRALAQGLGPFARARALWALPPRLTRAPRAARTLELETSVRR